MYMLYRLRCLLLVAHQSAALTHPAYHFSWDHIMAKASHGFSTSLARMKSSVVVVFVIIVDVFVVVVIITVDSCLVCFVQSVRRLFVWSLMQLCQLVESSTATIRYSCCCCGIAFNFVEFLLVVFCPLISICCSLVIALLFILLKCCFVLLLLLLLLLLICVVIFYGVSVKLQFLSSINAGHAHVAAALNESNINTRIQ